MHLTYRKMHAEDFEDLHSMVSHWSVVRQLGGWPWPADPVFTQSRCLPSEGEGFVWAICLDNRFCGSIGIKRGELGYMLAPAYHGKGIATQAGQAAITWYFDNNDQDLIAARTWFDNLASYRVLQKLGFDHWATRYEHAKARGFPTLTHDHRLTRDDWHRLRTAAQ